MRERNAGEGEEAGMTIEDPTPAVAVSPTDHSSDRAASDANQAENLKRNTDDRTQSDINQAIIGSRIEELISATRVLSDATTDALGVTKSETENARLARRRFLIVLLAIPIIPVGLLVPILVNSGRVLSTQQQLKDCVTPSGSCYMDAQAHTRQAVLDIDKITVLAAACAPNFVSLPLPRRTVAITECIQKGLKK